MKPIPGMPPARLQDLSRIVDRLSFLYVERAILHRESNAITVKMQKGTVHVPAATLGVVMLGPGTSISHQAMMLLADSGATSVWIGEEGVRYYAHGRPLTRSSRLLEAQALASTNRLRRLEVARRMYAMRFPGEDVSGATMQQLRGKEGARVKRLYRHHANEHGVEWRGRKYDPNDFESSDILNMALSAATSCLYGIVHSVTVALGCSPGLGFVHTGHDRSFVYDIADLYKMEVAVPVAFAVAASDSDDVPGDVRRAMRDSIHEHKLLEKCVRDIQTLLDEDGAVEFEADVIYLWDGSDRLVAGGSHYSDEEPPW